MLRDDLFIPGVVNEDENDPCRKASVSASSVSETEIFAARHGTVVEPMPLDVARICNHSFNKNTHGDIKEVFVWLRSENAEPTTIQVAGRIKGDIDSFTPDSEPCYAEAVVPPMHEGWLKIDIHIPVTPDPMHPSGKLEFWIEPAKGIRWGYMTNLSFYNICGVRGDNGEWKRWSGANHMILVIEPQEQKANCAPENVINGVSRIRTPEIYEWVSDPKESLPQWICLDLKEPAEINSVSVVFDTDLTNPGTCWGIKIPTVPRCVKDYEIEIFSYGEWKKIAEVEGNFMRKRIHEFDAVIAEKIRVNVLSTWGDPSARIMEIRAALER